MQSYEKLFLDSLMSCLPTQVQQTIKYIGNSQYTDLITKAKKWALGGGTPNKNYNGNLHSVFNTLQGHNATNNATKRYLGQSLTILNTITPVDNPQACDFSSQFSKDYQQLQNKSAESVLALMQYYYTYTACGYQGLEDISLYQLAKTTAGLAVALADAQDDKLLFIGGDLSGIQDYIYSITSKSASKNLKGRSFYLHILVSTVIETILEKLSIPRASVIYQSGGGFYIIAPQRCKDKLKEVKTDLSDKLYKAHKHQLFLAIDSITISVQDTAGNSLSDQWKALGEALNKDKRRKFVNKFSELFTPQKVSQEKIDCCTGQEIDENEGFETFNDEDNEGGQQLYVSKLTKQLIELGGALKNADIFVLTKEQPREQKNGFPILDKYFYTFSKEQWAGAKNQFTSAIVTVLNNTDHFKKLLLESTNNTILFDYYGGNDYPTEQYKHEPKSFDELAGGGSYKRIGVLRMDVDSLGSCFQNGIEENKRTLARYSTLSNSLDVFFKGYINTLWASKEDYKEHISIIYAGGDDLFIVGRWDYTINFAEELKEKFAQYTAGNSKMSLSAGMAIVHGKFPIHRAAELADGLEKSAKNHKWLNNNNPQEKNSFDFLGKPLAWGTEFKKVKELQEKLVGFIGNNHLPKSYLEKITTLYDMKQEEEKKPTEQRKLNWMWMLVYDVARNKPKDAVALNFVNDNKNKILNATSGNNPTSIRQGYDDLDILALACRWAELLVRTNKNDNN
ncbi:MAG: type III-A CRISPR-associated protein Cas10/Csm1 [Phycisphaerales bacterium]|nr:type III-A CRISPR-associated protein Cas10/Csm1 [Phycisphaerales bacterium]